MLTMISGSSSAARAGAHLPRPAATAVPALHHPSRPQRGRLAVAAQARKQLAGPERIAISRSESPGLSSALGTSIEYRVKDGVPAPGSPLLEFMDKLRLAWNIFFPERPPELSAKEQGKQRLRMILVADRCGLSPVGLTEMKKNILRSIEAYVDIESEEQIDVSITLEPEVGTVYSVAVPIRRVKPEARMAWDAEGELGEEVLTLEYDPDNFESDPSSRFPYGT